MRVAILATIPLLAICVHSILWAQVGKPLPERAYTLMEAYKDRCLYYSPGISLPRPPGPLKPEQVEPYLREIEDRLRYGSNRGTTEEFIRGQLRAVSLAATATAENLCELIRSDDVAIASNAMEEALLRREKRCIPALSQCAQRVPAKGADPSLSAMYVHALAMLGGRDTRDMLRKLLSAPNGVVRLTAAYELSFFGDASGLVILREAFRREAKNPNQFPPLFRAVRIGARLIALGDADTPASARSLLQPLGIQGRYLLPVLAERRKPEVLQMLREMVVNRKEGMRKWAVIALARVKDRKAVPYLLRALDDPHREVIMEATRALERIGDPSAAPAIRRAAEKVRPRYVLIDHPGGPVNLADEMLRVADALESRPR